MARPTPDLTRRGLELIRGGMPLRAAAKLLGLNNSSLVRAAAREGLVLPRGRPPGNAG